MLVATAGHIDHGKTALVRALTGVETDRLPAEKARGISIDLGFAYWPQPDGTTIGFVDVPGHERFVRNMVAGICGVDLALIVVAADDGIMPQTIEHVRILDLLGVSSALVAINKCDRVGADRIAQVRSDVSALLAGTCFADAPKFEVSSITGAAVGDLATALRSAHVGRSAPLVGGHHLRIAIDRVFAVTGAGTVAAGTVLAGSVRVGDRLTLSPSGKPVRVRGIQSAGRDVGQAQAGERCALNLAGAQVSDVRRGDCIVSPEMHAPTSRIEARVRALEVPIKHNGNLHLHLGTADLVARVVIAGQAAISAGDTGIVHLLMQEPTSAVAGEAFILRDPSGQRLIGGGVVIDPYAQVGRQRRVDRAAVTAAMALLDPEQVIEALCAVPGFEFDVERFRQCYNLTEAMAQALLAGAEIAPLGKGGRLALPRVRVERVAAQLLEALSAVHADRPDLPGLSAQSLSKRVAEPVSVPALTAILRDMSDQQRVSLSGSLAKLPGHAPSFSPAETALWDDLVTWVEAGDPGPFTTEAAARETRSKEAMLKAVLYQRCANGDLYRMDERRFLLRTHLDALTEIAARLGPDFSAAQFRDASGIGRNMVIRILEFLDGRGITVRNGDLRNMAG